MRLETLDETVQKKRDLEKEIEDKTGQVEGPITQKIASADLTEELKEEAGIIQKLQSAENSLEKAQGLLDSIGTEKHERYQEKLSEKGTYNGEKEYHDLETEIANKGSKALEKFLAAIKGEKKEEIFLEINEKEPDEGFFNREEITSKLLKASKEISGAEKVLRTQDNPDINDKTYEELKDLADEIRKERLDILEITQNADSYLGVAEKAVNKA